MKWHFYMGLIASICIAVYMMPQLIRTIKTKDTVGVSIVMLILAVVGDTFFVIDGIGILTDVSAFQSVTARLSAGLPIFLANCFGLIISAITAFFKFRNMYRAKKLNISEKDFCLAYGENIKRYKAAFGKKKDQNQGM